MLSIIFPAGFLNPRQSLGDVCPPVFSVHWVSLLHHIWTLPALNCTSEASAQQLKAWEFDRALRTASLNMSADFSNRSHPIWNQKPRDTEKQSGTILLGMCAACLSIHQGEFQYFNSSRMLQLSAQRCVVQGRCAAGWEKSTIKDDYSKIDFL